MRVRHVQLLVPMLLLAGAIPAGCGGSEPEYSCEYESKVYTVSEFGSSSGDWTYYCIPVDDAEHCDMLTDTENDCSGGFCSEIRYRNDEFFEGTCDDRSVAPPAADDNEPALADEATTDEPGLVEEQTATPPPTTTTPPRPTTVPPPPTAPPTEYVQVSDSTGSLAFDVPSGWAELDTGSLTATDGSVIPRLVAAPDLTWFQGSYEGPGVMVARFGAADALAQPAGTWLAAMTETDRTNCVVAQADESAGEAHIVMTDCTDADSNIAAYALDSNDGTHRLLVIFQWLVPNEMPHLERVFESLVIR